MLLSPSVIHILNGCVLIWLATTDDAGQPNVSPKELFAPLGDRSILIANVASPRSVSNLRRNNMVCVSFVDVFKETGFKCHGIAHVIGPDSPHFDQDGQVLRMRTGRDFPIQHLIEVEVTSVSSILVPSVYYNAETTEQDRRERAYARYGVAPLADGLSNGSRPGRPRFDA